MIRLKTPKILLATVLVASSIAAFAQTNGSAAAEAPTAVGVTKQEAAKAMKKAVPNSNIATVVNTDPKATNSAPAPAANVTTTTPAATMADAPPKMIKRKARADRN